MAVAEISFAESALGDLAGIQAWYAEEGVPEVGDRFVAEIFERVEVLTEHRISGASFRSSASPSCAS